MSDEPATQDTEETAEGLFPIRTVSSITGVNPVTLRAWERRYGLIRPHRTPKGHRLYSQEDIQRIQRVLELLDQGISISQARQLVERPEPGPQAEAGDPWEKYRERMLQAVVRFDEQALDHAYNEVLSLYPEEMVTRRLLLPLLETLGERWANRSGTVAEEHFFGSYLRNKIGARFHHQFRRGEGPRLIAACLPGEQHEVGLLLFCLAAANHGYQPVLLGANMPLEELPLAARRANADAIILSSSYQPAAETLSRELQRMARGAALPVYMGGRASIRHRDALTRAGVTPLGIDIGPALARLDSDLRQGG